MEKIKWSITNHFDVVNNEPWYIVAYITFFMITFKIIIHCNNYLEYSLSPI